MWLIYKPENGAWTGWIPGPSLTSLPPLQYAMPTQRAEVLLQVPYSETNEEAAFPLQEEAEDGGPGEWIGLGSSMGDTSPCLSLYLMSLPLSLPLRPTRIPCCLQRL